MDAKFPPDVADLTARLREERPTLSPLELDRLRKRVAARPVPERQPRLLRSPLFLGSRLAVTMLLTLGIVIGTTGAGLAVSGLSGGGSAGQGQYDQPGENAGGQEKGETQGAVLGKAEHSPAAKQGAKQVAAVEEGGGESLPFTGSVGIPLLLTGVAMLATGLLVRRRV
jgi:hypothetical protein